MISSPDSGSARIMPAQVWALMAPERQQQIVRLLAHLAVQVIGATCSRPDGLGIGKETGDAYPTRPVQTAARPS